MRNHMDAGWFYSPSQIGHYLLTRIPSLRPPRVWHFWHFALTTPLAEVANSIQNSHAKNPIKVLRQLNRHQWLMFWAGFLGWTWDAFDFFTVSLTVTEIAKDFGVPNSEVTWGLTVTLMLRSVGALIFGSLSDRYGRKWPFVINLSALVVLELGTGFTKSLSEFLAVRALFGIAMGGLFGPAASTALEDLPYEARGILSGLFEQGYATGYLLAAIFYRALVPTTSHGWRSLFWFGAGPPILIIIFRICLPETNHFLVQRAERETRHAMREEAQSDGTTSQVPSNGIRAFGREALVALRRNWVLLVYMVILMSGFNSCSHGSQDFYPTFLKDQVGQSATNTTIITVIGQLGAFIGGTIIGYASSVFGRRLTMCICCVIGGALVPGYILPRSLTLIAPVFFMQFFVGGIWGPIPIHLMELAPPALRTLVVGLTYQLGNLVSSASATIQSTIGEKYPLLLNANGTKRFNYGKVIGIFMGAVWAYILLFLLLGPEMSEDEREQQRMEALAFEEERTSGRSLREMGIRKARQNAAADIVTEKQKAESVEDSQVEDLARYEANL